MRRLALAALLTTISALTPSTAKIAAQQQRLNSLTGFNALVLNADYQPLSFLPLSVWSWQDAIKAAWQGRVDVVAEYDVTIRSASAAFAVPSVVELRNYEPRSIKAPRYSKRLLLLRDGYCCQYCRQRFHSSQLTADHVIPRAAGGKSSWDNVVASCMPCNHKKGPRGGRQFCLAKYKRADIPETWDAYLREAIDAADDAFQHDAPPRTRRGKAGKAHHLPALAKPAPGVVLSSR
ncbi:HNH endonuclease [Aureococcus anophagefferens]|nr:HNH endonuclease [Aureococcus anophagefferens]